MFTAFGRSGRVWLGVVLSAGVVLAGVTACGAVTGVAAYAGKHQDNGRRGPLICRKDGRRTVERYGVYYIVRNDVILPEQECIRLVRKKGPGFVVTRTHADSRTGENSAFPEVLYVPQVDRRRVRDLAQGLRPGHTQVLGAHQAAQAAKQAPQVAVRIGHRKPAMSAAASQ